jgi:hypothetical protein
MLKAGKHNDVWRDFSLKNAELAPKHDFPDDQGWLWYKIPRCCRMEGRTRVRGVRFPKASMAEGRRTARGCEAGSVLRMARSRQIHEAGLGESQLEVIDPKKTCLYIPDGLSRFKANLFDRIGSKLGKIVRGKVDELAALPDDVLPVVGCSPELTGLIRKWRETNRTFCYWDRGYAGGFLQRGCLEVRRADFTDGT